MRKIAFINEKGGTGKTTLTVNFATYLAIFKNKKVLIIDMDPQGHSGKSLGINVHSIQNSVFDLLVDDTLHPRRVIMKTRFENLFIIPSNKSLSDLPTVAPSLIDKFHILKKRTDQLEKYDFIIFDTPPSIGIQTINVLTTANEIVIPVALTYLSLDGCAELLSTIEQIKSEYRQEGIKINSIIPTFYRRTALANEIIEKLRQHFGNLLIDTPISFNVKIDEAQSFGKSIWEYALNSKGAEVLKIVSEEIIRRGV